MTQVLIGLPHYLCRTDTRGAISGMEMMLYAEQFGFSPSFKLADVCGVANARNDIMNRALALLDHPKLPDLRWLLCWDADVYWDPAWAPWRMMNDALGLGAAVIGAPVLERTGRWNCRHKDTGRHFEPEPAIQSVRALGGGMTAYFLPWYARHWKARPWFQEVQTEKGPLGEDVTHCVQVAQLGGAVYCDGRFRPDHGILRPGDVIAPPAATEATP